MVCIREILGPRPQLICGPEPMASLVLEEVTPDESGREVGERHSDARLVPWSLDGFPCYETPT